MSCPCCKCRVRKSNPEIITAFLEKYKESILWANSNINDAAKLVEKFKIGMDAATAQEAIPRCNIKYSDSNQSKDLVNDYLKTLFDFSPEDIGGKVLMKNFITKKDGIFTLISFVLIIAIWKICSLFISSEIILPSPEKTIMSLFNL